ncbi:MAG: AAA family ATPase [Chloroflexi bacterium]|nr:AAA family ATPase [Chloroflexota bacterium]
MKCPNCAYDGPSGMKFCGMCGLRLARECSACDFCNPPDFNFCGQCGTPLTKDSASPQPPLAVEDQTATLPASRYPSPPISLEGERRLATVILADVTGSTNLLEQIGTEAWVEMMNRILQILEAEIYRFGGEVDQFRGDGLVAFFGTTSAHEDDPERAVLAALAMQQVIRPYAAELSERESINLLLRVGVNTGDVIVASIGDSRQHSEDTAMGEAIAVAARMETAAEPGTVLVSENTYRLLQSQFEWESLGEIMIKGVSQPIAVYRPLFPRTDVEQPHSLQAYGLSTPFIGREDEFHTLKSCVKDLYDGRGGIAMVTGDKGMGKSFLVNEVRHHFVRHGVLLAEAYDKESSPPAALTWLRGRCRSYSQSSPYSMWLDLLQNWLHIHPAESKETARDHLCHQAKALWGDRWTEHYPYLATFLSLPLEETFVERIKYLDAEGLRQQFFLTIQSWVEEMSKRGPLVLAFADVHWADTTSLGLLKYCLPLCDHQALLWLIVCRPDRSSPAWEFHHRIETEYPHRLTTLTLPPLTDDQSCEFIDQLVGQKVLSANTCTLIAGKAEGNPYYVGELVQSLIEQEVLVRDVETSRWRVMRAVASLDLPDTLQSLLLARIDNLSRGERRVLQMAAVIGPVFWSNVLQALASGSAALETSSLKAHLTALQRAQLVNERRRVPALGMEYVFKSNLIRDAAYEGLLGTQRAVYHLQAAEYLEDFFGLEALSSYYDVLAYHYCQAGHRGKELFYTIQAAEQAQEIYANAEALAHYAHALELLDKMEEYVANEDGNENRLYTISTQRFEALNGRRKLSFLMGDFDAMWADAQALLPLARQLDDDPVWLVDALLEQPGVAGWRHKEDLDAAVPMAQQALALSQQLGDRHREMQCLTVVARLCLWRNDPQAWELAEQAFELAQQLGDQRHEVGILIGMGHIYATSEPERSMKYLEAALPISQVLDDKMTELEILGLIGVQLESSGDYCQRLTECYGERLRLSREIGHRPAEAETLMFYGQILALYLGDYEAGLAMLEESLSIWEGMPGELFCLLRIAQIYTVQAQHDEAFMVLERAHRIGERYSEDMARTGLDLVSIILHNALGDEEHLALALELATQNRQVFVDNSQLSDQYRMVAACEAAAAHLGLSQAVADAPKHQHHLHQALESSQAALDIYQSFGYVRPIECVSEEIFFRHSQALAANGREAEAAEYLQRAHEEMMRKHDLIPPDSSFRRTYLDNIPLHRDIRAAYTANTNLQRVAE